MLRMPKTRLTTQYATVPHPDLSYYSDVFVRVNGVLENFTIPNEMDPDLDCIICTQPMKFGVPVGLPFCGGCNLNESLTTHAECARGYCGFDIPQLKRPPVKHLFCPEMHQPKPPCLTHCILKNVCDAWDDAKIPSHQRCSPCMPL